MQDYLRQVYPHLTLQVIYPNKFPEFLAWIKGAQDAWIYSDNKERALAYLSACDLIFCMDFNQLSRLEELGEKIQNMDAKRILIDHHLQPDSAFDVVFSDPDISSTCELTYSIIEALGDKNKIQPATAEALYAGILTDTGSFSYNIKSSRTFRVAADLMELGIDKDAITARVNNSYNLERLRLLGYVLKDKMVVVAQQAVYIALSRQELEAYHFEQGDTESFVNFPLSIKTINLSAFFYESLDRSHIRVSLRSKGQKVSANALAQQHFNGGGHFNAAGGKFWGTLEECCAYFEKILIDEGF
jgi:phosphoesterase RecJ-like protein